MGACRKDGGAGRKAGAGWRINCSIRHPNAGLVTHDGDLPSVEYQLEGERRAHPHANRAPWRD